MTPEFIAMLCEAFELELRGDELYDYHRDVVYPLQQTNRGFLLYLAQKKMQEAFDEGVCSNQNKIRESIGLEAL